MKPRGAIVQDEFEDRFCVLLEPFDAEGDHFAVRDRRFVQLQFRDRPEVAAVLITPWPVQQKVFDSTDFQPSELRGAFRTNAPKGGHRRGQGWNLLIGRDNSHV